jgi:hypothetical protein
MDIGSMAMVATSLKSLADMAKALKDVNDAAVFQTKAFELTREIVNAQQNALGAQIAQQAMIDENRILKRRIAELEDWSVEKARYALTDHGCQTFTRSLKTEMANGDPPHRICIQCFEQGKKGMLHSHGIFSGGREKVECLSCGKEIMLGCDGPRQTSTRQRAEYF